MRQTSKKHTWTKVKKLLNQSCDDDDDSCQEYYKSSYTMLFEIDNVSVLKRRNKESNRCIENWKNDDLEMKSRISKQIKCKPSHWNLTLNLSKCSTMEEMHNVLSLEDIISIPSCYSIERYAFSYNEYAGMDVFDIGLEDFDDILEIDWKTKEWRNHIVSEILIDFVGKFT